MPLPVPPRPAMADDGPALPPVLELIRYNLPYGRVLLTAFDDDGAAVLDMRTSRALADEMAPDIARALARIKAKRRPPRRAAMRLAR